MNDVIQTIGGLIHQYRREAGMTLSQLSELTGIHKGTISRIENEDVKRPEFATVRPLATALKIPFEKLTELYIEIENRADALLSMLQGVIQETGNEELINKVGLKFLESPNEDSQTLIERLYSLVNGLEDQRIKLSLYMLIISYSRDHGIMRFLAKGLLQAYLIKRDDFSKLEAIYQAGLHIVHYTTFLSNEEALTLHYKLGVHAYNLMKYEECVDLCKYVIKNENTQSKIKANALYLTGLAYDCLGDHEKWEAYLKDYGSYNIPGVEENKKVTNALVNSRTGNMNLAIEQLKQLIPNVTDRNFIIIITRLFEIYLQYNDVHAARQLFAYEDKIKNIPVTTPITQLNIAYYYRLKGKTLIGDDIEGSFDSFYKSSLEYASISKFDEAFESLSLVSKELLNNTSLINVETISKIDLLYDELRLKGRSNKV
ncbi:helix-turn-helix domain-containing protein [Paenibacillus profundus]|uniref:Helix-turn-helix domain-containing protein n=1 Tax=Paenibacillus profundus TaxID=1173085 RepID=A0ABS8YCS5_9BACL|nr:helix-turn-helix transcriptional regulator [Paenibacillus profundus]MCE5168248.1 helix-turn-helix domain-containing protein [Paenibacillus profundus]